MIILFVLVGVLLLGGGAATIIDGLPYLVLERGFTQVIVGTVAATGGVLMLALSRVLLELRKVRTTLSNAMMAVSVASMSGEVSAPAPALAPGSSGDAALATGAGLAAGAGAALVATQVSAGETGTEDAPTSDKPADHETDEPDLFAQALSRDDDADWHASDAEAASAEEPAEPQEAPVYDQPAWLGEVDLEREQSTEATSEAAPESDLEPVEPTADLPEPDPEPDHAGAEAADLTSHEPAEQVASYDKRTEPWLGWPEKADEPIAEAEADKARTAAADEFDTLRESLASQLAEPDGKTDARSGHDAALADPLHDAETWMTSSGTRREPWFEQQDGQTAVAAEPGVDDAVEAAHTLQPPPWPPQTRDHAVEPTFTATWDDADRQGELAASETDPAEPADATPAEPVEQVSAPPAAIEPAEIDVSPAPEPEPAPPAASNEGIVGAYQVGDAHFTIFADGSIQARTPDGDYKFGSMEELKTYLASEKSRLGV